MFIRKFKINLDKLIDTVQMGELTVTTPKGQEPVDNGDNTATLPSGGTVVTPDGTKVILPGGTILDSEGNIVK